MTRRSSEWQSRFLYRNCHRGSSIVIRIAGLACAVAPAKRGGEGERGRGGERGRPIPPPHSGYGFHTVLQGVGDIYCLLDSVCCLIVGCSLIAGVRDGRETRKQSKARPRAPVSIMFVLTIVLKLIPVLQGLMQGRSGKCAGGRWWRWRQVRGGAGGDGRSTCPIRLFTWTPDPRPQTLPSTRPTLPTRPRP